MDFIEQVEKLGSKGTVQQSLKALRREAMREADEALMGGAEDGIGWAAGLVTKKPRRDAENDDDNVHDDNNVGGVPASNADNVVNDQEDDDDDYDQYMGAGPVENHGVDEDDLDDLLMDG